MGYDTQFTGRLWVVEINQLLYGESEWTGWYVTPRYAFNTRSEAREDVKWLKHQHGTRIKTCIVQYGPVRLKFPRF